MNETRPISAQLAQLFMTVHHPSDGSDRVPISYSIASLLGKPYLATPLSSRLSPFPIATRPPPLPARPPYVRTVSPPCVHAVAPAPPGPSATGIAPPPGFAVWVVRPQERREGVARASAPGWYLHVGSAVLQPGSAPLELPLRLLPHAPSDPGQHIGLPPHLPLSFTNTSDLVTIFTVLFEMSWRLAWQRRYPVCRFQFILVYVL
jgi:hypothetical protein